MKGIYFVWQKQKDVLVPPTAIFWKNSEISPDYIVKTIYDFEVSLAMFPKTIRALFGKFTF